MANGSLTLLEYPGEIVRLACSRCGRAGQYPKQKLIAQYGADIRLPDLREEIAQCERRGQMHDMCGVGASLRDAKMRMGATHFLMKRLPKVATEMALHVLAYNLTRVINILGVQPLMAAMRA